MKTMLDIIDGRIYNLHKEFREYKQELEKRYFEDQEQSEKMIDMALEDIKMILDNVKKQRINLVKLERGF